MSEKKIIVPEGMLEAAREEWRNGRNSDLPSTLVNHILEDALLWLSENPIVPTYEQTETMRRMFRYTTEPLRVYQDVATEWQRRCFLAPKEHPILEVWLKDADAMGLHNSMKVNFMRLFDQAFQAGRESMVPSAVPAEPEVPKEIKDLLRIDSGHEGSVINADIIEAFRRGQKAGAK